MLKKRFFTLISLYYLWAKFFAILSISVPLLDLVSARDKLPNNWNQESRDIYQLMVAQLQNANDDYKSSVDTLVKFALNQKTDTLYSKAFQSLIQLKQYGRALLVMKEWEENGSVDLPMLYVFALVMDGQLNKAEQKAENFFNESHSDSQQVDSSPHSTIPKGSDADFNVNFLIDLLSDHWYEKNIMQFITKLHYKYPDNKRLSVLAIQILRWQLKIDEAIEIVNKKLFASPRDLFWLSSKSKIYRYALALEKAENVWLDALKDEPKNQDIQANYVYFLFDTYQWKKLQKYLVNNQKLIADNSEIDLLKAISFVYQKEYQKALALLKEWENLDKNMFIDYQFTLVESLFTMGEWGLAKKVLQSIESDNTEELIAKEHNLLVVDYLENETEKKGNDRLSKLQQDYFLTDSEATIIKAQSLEEADEYDRALDTVNQFLETHPNDSEVRYYRAILLEIMGLSQQAIADLDYLYHRYPNEKEYQNALGYTLLSDDTQLVKAQELIEKAMFTQPRSPHIVDSLGWLKVKQKSYQSALPLLKFSYVNMNYPETISHYITALFYSGKTDMALKLYELENKNPKNEKEMKRIIGDLLDAL